jgi:hypothetical protein
MSPGQGDASSSTTSLSCFVVDDELMRSSKACPCRKASRFASATSAASSSSFSPSRVQGKVTIDVCERKRNEASVPVSGKDRLSNVSLVLCLVCPMTP